MMFLVLFPHRSSACCILCDGSLPGLERAVRVHRYAIRPIGEMFFKRQMPDGQTIRVEVDESSFSEVKPELDVLYVSWSESPQPRPTPPRLPSPHAPDGPSPAATPSPAACPDPPGRVPVTVPRLHLTPELLRPPEPSPPQERSGTQVTSAQQALQRLEGSRGRIEAIKVPQFLRSVSVTFVSDDLWHRIASCQISQDGYISNRDLCRILQHYVSAESKPTPGHEPTSRDYTLRSPQPPPECVADELLIAHSGGSSRGGSRRQSPHVPTPRTSYTPRDRLPLGCSAVSPIPGNTLSEILAHYDSRGSSRSNSQDSRGREGWRGGAAAPRKHHRSRSASSRSITSLRTVADAADAWPEFRAGGGGSFRPRRPPAAAAAADPRRRPARSDKEVHRVGQAALHVLRGCDGATLDASELPVVCAIVQLPCGTSHVQRTLAAIGLAPNAPLRRRELGLVLSRIARLPVEQAIAHTTDGLEACLQDSSRGDDAGRDAKPAADLAGLTGFTRDQRPWNRDGSHTTSRAGSAGSQLMPCPNCNVALGGAAAAVCGNCRLASYCCSRCQQEDWSRHQPICDTITQHMSKHRPVKVLARHDGHPFHVQVVLSDALMMSAPADSPPPPQGSQYLFVVSQRAPVLRSVFIVLSSVSGQCEFSSPHVPPNLNDSAIHALLLDVFSAVFEEAVTLGVWTLAGCCLGPMRGYFSGSKNYDVLVEHLRDYYSAFLREELQTAVECTSDVAYELIVQPLDALAEAYEAQALATTRTDDRYSDPRQTGMLAQAKDAYLQLISYLRETRFVPALRGRADVDRVATMRKLAVVYQHLAARERGNRALNYLRQGEDVMKELVHEDPSAESYQLLALLYESLPNDEGYRRKALQVREKLSAAEVTATPGSGSRHDGRRRGDGSAAGSNTLGRPPRRGPRAQPCAASPASDTLPRCPVCQGLGDVQHKKWNKRAREMTYYCSEEHKRSGAHVAD